MKAHQLLSDSSKWTNLLASNSIGQEVLPHDKSAVRWNAWGAIIRCYTYPANNDYSYAPVKFAIKLSNLEKSMFERRIALGICLIKDFKVLKSLLTEFDL